MIVIGAIEIFQDRRPRKVGTWMIGDLEDLDGYQTETS